MVFIETTDVAASTKTSCSESTDLIDGCALGSEVCMQIEENSEGQMECFRAACDLLEELIRENDCHQVGCNSGYINM